MTAPYINTGAIRTDTHGTDRQALVDLGGTDVLLIYAAFDDMGRYSSFARVARRETFRSDWVLGTPTQITFPPTADDGGVREKSACLLSPGTVLFSWTYDYGNVVTGSGRQELHARVLTISDLTITVHADVEYATTAMHTPNDRATPTAVKRLTDTSAIVAWVRSDLTPDPPTSERGVSKLTVSGTSVSVTAEEALLIGNDWENAWNLEPVTATKVLWPVRAITANTQQLKLLDISGTPTIVDTETYGTGPAGGRHPLVQRVSDTEAVLVRADSTSSTASNTVYPITVSGSTLTVGAGQAPGGFNLVGQPWVIGVEADRIIVRTSYAGSQALVQSLLWPSLALAPEPFSASGGGQLGFTGTDFSLSGAFFRPRDGDGFADPIWTASVGAQSIFDFLSSAAIRPGTPVPVYCQALGPCDPEIRNDKVLARGPRMGSTSTPYDALHSLTLDQDTEMLDAPAAAFDGTSALLSFVDFTPAFRPVWNSRYYAPTNLGTTSPPSWASTAGGIQRIDDERALILWRELRIISISSREYRIKCAVLTWGTPDDPFHYGVSSGGPTVGPVLTLASRTTTDTDSQENFLEAGDCVVIDTATAVVGWSDQPDGAQNFFARRELRTVTISGDTVSLSGIGFSDGGTTVTQGFQFWKLDDTTVFGIVNKWTPGDFTGTSRAYSVDFMFYDVSAGTVTDSIWKFHAGADPDDSYQPVVGIGDAVELPDGRWCMGFSDLSAYNPSGGVTNPRTGTYQKGQGANFVILVSISGTTPTVSQHHYAPETAVIPFSLDSQQPPGGMAADPNDGNRILWQRGSAEEVGAGGTSLSGSLQLVTVPPSGAPTFGPPQHFFTRIVGDVWWDADGTIFTSYLDGAANHLMERGTLDEFDQYINYSDSGANFVSCNVGIPRLAIIRSDDNTWFIFNTTDQGVYPAEIEPGIAPVDLQYIEDEDGIRCVALLKRHGDELEWTSRLILGPARDYMSDGFNTDVCTLSDHTGVVAWLADPDGYESGPYAAVIQRSGDALAAGDMTYIPDSWGPGDGWDDETAILAIPLAEDRLVFIWSQSQDADNYGRPMARAATVAGTTLTLGPEVQLPFDEGLDYHNNGSAGPLAAAGLTDRLVVLSYTDLTEDGWSAKLVVALSVDPDTLDITWGPRPNVLVRASDRDASHCGARLSATEAAFIVADGEAVVPCSVPDSFGAYRPSLNVVSVDPDTLAVVVTGRATLDPPWTDLDDTGYTEHVSITHLGHNRFFVAWVDDDYALYEYGTYAGYQIGWTGDPCAWTRCGVGYEDMLIFGSDFNWGGSDGRVVAFPDSGTMLFTYAREGDFFATTPRPEYSYDEDSEYDWQSAVVPNDGSDQNYWAQAWVFTAPCWCGNEASQATINEGTRVRTPAALHIRWEPPQITTVSAERTKCTDCAPSTTIQDEGRRITTRGGRT